MYCILIAGLPACGKSTLAASLADALALPFFSKDEIKERLFDAVGFRSREEKVRLGVASEEILYDVAEQMMKRRQAFLLENNFEDASRPRLARLLDASGYPAFTVALTGERKALYERYVARCASPERHLGHTVNDRYPPAPGAPLPAPVSYEDFVSGIERRGMDRFAVNGPRLVLDVTDLQRLDVASALARIRSWRDGLPRA